MSKEAADAQLKEVMKSGALLLHKIAVTMVDSEMNSDMFAELQSALIDVTATFETIRGLLIIKETLDQT